MGENMLAGIRRKSLIAALSSLILITANAGFSATVNTPMTQDLDGALYDIYNVANLEVRGPWADVRAFGADPAGTADSSTAFNNAASSGVGTVFVPKGTYRLNSAITLSVNFIAESGAVILNYYGGGTAITCSGVGLVMEGFRLVSKASGQNGICIPAGGFMKVRYIGIEDFDGIGLRIGVAGTSGVYYNDVSEVYCKNYSTVHGTTGLLVDGQATPNSNANTFKNVAVWGKWTTLYHIKGSQNLFLMGDAVVDTQGGGCDDVWKIEGIGNEFRGCYNELRAGSSLPTRIFNFTSTSASNRIKDIYSCLGVCNTEYYIDDLGWSNEVSYTPIGYNFAFPVESRGVENLIPNSHFKYWSGSTPIGWQTWNSNVYQDSANVRGAKYSLKLSGTGNNLKCYVAGNSSSITGYPIERFRGKNLVAGVWVKSSVWANPLKIWADGTGGAGYGNNYHSGDGTWQFVTANIKVPENASCLYIQLRNGTASSNDMYFSEPVLIEGNHLSYPNPRPLNDSYSRMTGPFIGSPFITFASGDTTPDVSDGNHFKTANTSATAISGFDNGTAGQEITIIFTDVNTSVSDAGNIKLSGSFTSTVNATLKLVYDGTSWFELSRSFN